MGGSVCGRRLRAACWGARTDDGACGVMARNAAIMLGERAGECVRCVRCVRQGAVDYARGLLLRMRRAHVIGVVDALVEPSAWVGAAAVARHEEVAIARIKVAGPRILDSAAGARGQGMRTEGVGG